MNLYSATAEVHKPTATGVRRTGPQNPFVEFKIEWTERSILNRFRSVARDYHEKVALKTKQGTYSYGDIDETLQSPWASHSLQARQIARTGCSVAGARCRSTCGDVGCPEGRQILCDPGSVLPPGA